MAKRDRWDDDDVLETARRPQYAELEVRHGIRLTHGGSRFTGTVAGFSEGDRVLLVGDSGRKESFRAWDGAFLHDGVRVALRAPAAPSAAQRRFTPSGSLEAPDERARVARASRIWVEGIHDAELIEKVWGADLRAEGVVVEPLHGADDLAVAVAGFRPGPGRRLGVLLDHLVAGSKESRIAAAVRHPEVLVTGHPYVDIWQAIRPATIGITAWPAVPQGRPWKEGVIDALGFRTEPGPFWSRVLAAVATYRDIETPLVNAVEQLIDFVAAD